MQTVDTRGQSCPAPLIATKRVLKESVKGEAFRILIGSQNALNNISRFLKDNRVVFSVEESGGYWTMTVLKEEDEITRPEAEKYCQDHCAEENVVNS